MPRNYTDITILLDRSGSMSETRQATIDGVNHFIAEQGEIPGEGCWSMIQFDDQYEVVYRCVDQKEVPPLTPATFVPRGSTALLDAIGRTVLELEERVFREGPDAAPRNVLVVIMTDGRENSSVKWVSCEPEPGLPRMPKHYLVSQLVARVRENYGWQFIYLGANQDAIAEAGNLNIPSKMSKTYIQDAAGTQEAYDFASDSTRAWKAEGNDSAAGFVIDPRGEAKT